MRKLPVVLALLALAPFALAACGGDDDGDDEAAAPETPAEEPADENGGGDGGGGAATLEVSADPGGALEYEQSSLETEAGEVTVNFTNDSSTEHDVVIEDPSGQEVAATDVIMEDTATTTASLESGEYTFYCSVPGHREAGMEGPLAVE